jgi:20S proteasome alpha/beta subunit
MEDTAGYTSKRRVYKLKLFGECDWLVVVGGAGDSVIAENAMQRLEQSLTSHKQLTQQILADSVDDVLAIIHQKYIDPVQNSEGIGLIVGALIGKSAHLLSTHKRTHQFHDSYAYAGIGADLAIYFAEKLYRDDDSWENNANVAALILSQVKETSQFCGLGSQLFVLQSPPNPRWRSFGEAAMDEMDNRSSHWLSEAFQLVLDKSHSHPISKTKFADDEDYEEEPQP